MHVQRLSESGREITVSRNVGVDWTTNLESTIEDLRMWINLNWLKITCSGGDGLNTVMEFGFIYGRKFLD
jgi:hypothetical protein